MAILMCNFWAFLLTAAVLGALPVKDQLRELRDGSQFVLAAWVFIAPLPMLTILYTLYAKFVRWRTRSAESG